MEIRFFGQKDNDFKDLNSMAMKHNMAPLKLENIPVLGIVAEKHNEIVAMGFLRQCEGYYGVVDSIITNTDSKPQDRNAALNLIFQELINMAKELHIRNLIGFSRETSTVERSKAFGFKEIEHRLMSLEIEG